MGTDLQIQGPKKHRAILTPGGDGGGGMSIHREEENIQRVYTEEYT